MPTAAERARHEVDYCQYQARCRSCVADPHFRRESEEDGVLYVAADYAFMASEVVDCRMTSACRTSCTDSTNPDGLTTHGVELNGADAWTPTVATRDISLSGLQEFVHKSDSERSVVALKHQVARRLRRGAGPIGVQFEDGGVGESQGIAVVERAIWEIESMTRTLVHAGQSSVMSSSN